MNITIEYLSRTSEHHWAANLVHIMVDGKFTLCGRRPARFTQTTDKATCEKCIEYAQATTPRSDAEKPVEQALKPRKQQTQPKKAWTTTTKREPDGETYRRTRAWVLTPKGQALVDKWEQEEANT